MLSICIVYQVYLQIFIVFLKLISLAEMMVNVNSSGGAMSFYYYIVFMLDLHNSFMYAAEKRSANWLDI